MPIIQLKDGNGTLYNFSVSGDGSTENPFVPLSDLSVAGVPVSALAPVPVTSADHDAGNTQVQTIGDRGEPLSQNDSDLTELFTYDTNLEHVFGTQPLANVRGRLKVSTDFEDKQAAGRVGVLGEAIGIDCAGCQTVLAQISGTWAGTLTFEARGDAGNYAAINGMAPNGTALVSTTTGNGIFRFNTAGHQRFQVRLSAFTSGSAQVALIASAELAGVFVQNTVAVSGAVTATSTDAQIGNIFGTTGASPVTNFAALVRPAIEPMPIVPLAPIINATPTSNCLGRQPQYYSRLRVEAGGDKKLPFAQDLLTNQLMIQDDREKTVLEQLVYEQRVTNLLLIQAFNVEPPPEWALDK